MLSFQAHQEDLIHGYKVMVVAPNGEINSRSVRQFEKQLQDYYNVGYRFIVIDCANISTLSSEALNTMMNMVETFQKAGGILLMIRALPQISRFFDLEGYSPIFTSLTSEQEAMQYLNDQLQQAFESGNVAAATPPTPSPQTSVASPYQANPVHPQSPPLPSSQQPTVSQPQPQASPENANVSRKYNVTRQILPMMDVEVKYHKTMYRHGVFPLTLAVALPEKYHGRETIEVTPVFPGCLVVPSSRVVGIKEQKTIFWVTPLACKKMQGAIEFAKEDKSMQVDLPFKITRQNWSKWCFLLGIAVPLLLQWNPRQVSEVVAKLIAILGWPFPPIFLGTAAGLILVLMALMAFLVNRPRRAKPVMARLNFQ